jgi:NAD(P)H-dependent FMN reductase
MKIQLIIGSTRPGRVGPQIADWILKQLPVTTETTCELIDLNGFNLPLFDEPALPSMSQYTHDYTKKWSQKIKEGDAYIFLTPEYNAGYPAALKNAIDYLYHEWTDKPVLIVSYGAHGGLSAQAQLLQVAERLKMKPVPLRPAFTITPEITAEDRTIANIDQSFAQYAQSVKTAVAQLLDAGTTPDAKIA